VGRSIITKAVAAKVVPVVLPLHALVAKDVAVVAPRRVGDVHGLALHEASDEGGRDAEGAGAGERVQAHHAVLRACGVRVGGSGRATLVSS
jgi:hypothetical protein